jgi:NAD(P)-dependent dehydrogenase (short-subunit alcohol dehydrogenase family)
MKGKRMSKNWFVTGSSRGLGRDIVIAALEAGNKVFATARKAEQLDDLVAKYGDKLVPFALDVNDGAAAAAAVQKAKDIFGSLDVVINNAGYANTASVEDMTVEDFTEQVQTNFFGVYYVSKAAVPIMRAQGGGHIFQVASLGARLASVGLSAYQAGKFATRGFSLVLAQEVAPLGIKVVTLEPGGMRTDWAGSSMKVPTVSAPYEQTVGAFAKFLRQAAGSESSDPVKVAKLVVELSNRDGLPPELLIGADAVEYFGQAFADTLENDKKWRDVSISTKAD